MENQEYGVINNTSGYIIKIIQYGTLIVAIIAFINVIISIKKKNKKEIITYLGISIIFFLISFFNSMIHN